MAELVNTPDEGSAAEVEKPDDNTPEHLRGKSQQEILEMYTSLERKLGEQSEELGSLRKLADQALMTEKPASDLGAPDPGAGSDGADFWSDPEGYIKRVVTEATKPVQELTRKQQQEAAAVKLSQDFPNWKDTVADKEFQEWVARSKVRTDLFLRGDSGDVDAAAELFATWGDLSKAKDSTKASEKKAVERDRKMRAATTEKGSAGIDPRKILNRNDLRELKRTNPDRYNELLPDIRKAYAEGRVR